MEFTNAKGAVRFRKWNRQTQTAQCVLENGIDKRKRRNAF
jgi:hypothetical protein